MLVAALRLIHQGNGMRDFSKGAVLDFIQLNGWYNFYPTDHHPYPSVDGSEPRWRTLLAFARENGVEAGLIARGIRDEWMPTTEGLNALPSAKQCFVSGSWDVRKCYLWTYKMKEVFDPRILENWECDARPSAIYMDQIPCYYKSVRAFNSPRKYTLADLL